MLEYSHSNAEMGAVVSKDTSTSSIHDTSKIVEKCVFLSSDGKQCSVYESRPVQCRTFPYWPALLSKARNWEREAVLPSAPPQLRNSASSTPDHIINATINTTSACPVAASASTSVPIERSAMQTSSFSSSTAATVAVSAPNPPSKYWTLEGGGCEGINHADAPLVAPNNIHRNLELYNAYNADFPLSSTGKDREQFINKADLIQVQAGSN